MYQLGEGETFLLDEKSKEKGPTQRATNPTGDKGKKEKGFHREKVWHKTLVGPS